LRGRGSLRFSHFRLCALCSNTKKHLKCPWTKTVRRLALALEKGLQTPQQVFTLRLPGQGQADWPCLRK